MWGFRSWLFRAQTGLELLQLLWACQGLQEGILTLQLRVFLHQLSNLLLQDLHLLSHSIHQMILHQVLLQRKSKQSHSLAIMAPPQYFHFAYEVPTLSLMPLISGLPSAAIQNAGLTALFLLHPSLKHLDHHSGELHDQDHA